MSLRLLAIDTATEACSVALCVDGVIHERYEIAGRDHTQRLMPMVMQLMGDTGLGFNQLDGIVCGTGPGSFAGVRIGVGYVKGLALALDRPVIGVSSLAMMALRAVREKGAECVLSAIDARMNEVYFGLYQRSADGLVELQDQEQICAPDAAPQISLIQQGQVLTPVRPEVSKRVAVGSGWKAYREKLTQAVAVEVSEYLPDALPHAEDALRLAIPKFETGQVINADELVPVYLRDKVALTLIEQIALRKS